MALQEGQAVRTTAEVTGDDGKRVIPAGTPGVVMYVYGDGEAYAVDVKIDDQFDNVYATAEQVEPVS